MVSTLGALVLATMAFPGQWTSQPGPEAFPAWPAACDHVAPLELRVACLDATAKSFAGLGRYARANRELAAPKAGEERVVFFGDSITDNWSAPGGGGFFPDRPYVNRGIGGQTTAQMLLRFRPDVIDLRPKTVVILAGTNDIAGNSGPTDEKTIQDNLASMAELARAHGIRVVLASLLPVRDYRDPEGAIIAQTRQRPPAAIVSLNRWIADFARKNGVVFLDYDSAMADERGQLRADLTNDGLHPNASGYAVMAPLAEKAIAEAANRR